MDFGPRSRYHAGEDIRMKLLYFAWLKSKTGIGEEDVTPPPEVSTVAELLDWLAGRGPGYAAALADRRVVRVAVNQEYAGPEHPVAIGDEIALFPPVTGG
ncbi:MAG: molybdopterin synthase sulfur carrier subunit [Alphaproteobacteria bacterium]|nr:MAG: molybdopterin synthase sulfur carrier subunit [Alphaproteobacteria bacterium]